MQSVKKLKRTQPIAFIVRGKAVGIGDQNGISSERSGEKSRRRGAPCPAAALHPADARGWVTKLIGRPLNP